MPKENFSDYEITTDDETPEYDTEVELEGEYDQTVTVDPDEVVEECDDPAWCLIVFL